MGRLLKDTDFFGPLPPLPPGLPRNWDQVLLNENFAHGLAGWHTHTSSFPPHLSDHAFVGSPHSLALPTGFAAGNGGEHGGQNSIYKRLGSTFNDGYMLFGGWFGFRGDNEHGSPKSITLAMDHQTNDDSARSFNRLILRRYVGNTTGAETFSPRWSLSPDQIGGNTLGTNYFVDVPGTGGPQYPGVTGQGAAPGWNVNHGDYWFAALLVSLNQSDNQAGVGIGRYWRSYFGGQVFDLSGLLTGGVQTDTGANTWTSTGTKTGSGAENPQTDVSSGGPNAAGSFANGFNVGFGLANKLNGPDGSAALFAGHVFAAHYPAGTAFPTTGTVN